MLRGIDLAGGGSLQRGGTRSLIVSVAACCGGVLALALLMETVPGVSSGVASLLYLLAVLLSATSFGTLPALVAAGLASILFSYFNVGPYRAFGITSLEDAVRLGTFLSVAMVVGGLAGRARRQAHAAQRRSQELAALYDLSQAMAAAVDLDEVLLRVAQATRRLLNLRGCEVLLDNPSGELDCRAVDGTISADDARAEIALQTDERTLGVLRVAPWQPHLPLTAAERALLETIAAQTALVLERFRLTDEASKSRLLAESDRLKSTLLTLVSHDLRTPLSVIKGVVTSLMDETVQWTSEARRDLLAAINDETDRLNRLVGDLLEMSRIESGAVPQGRAPQDIGELVGSTAERVQRRLARSHIVVSAPPELPPVSVNYQQIDHVLGNLLENAAGYAPEGTTIEVQVRESSGVVRVAVLDEGPGVPDPLKERIFDKFVRGAAPERHAPGSGLGLAICRGLVEAHGGRIWVEDRPGGGASFVFTLPTTAPMVSAGELYATATSS